MKKITLILLFISVSFLSRAQNGLENIIVEKYYISDANDTMANADGGYLPVGSVTYRIYVDMLPGYTFQAAFGIPGNEMRIATSTTFFNNVDRGATSPTYTKTQASHNTVMLDSWLSVGSACVGNIGVPKTDDNGVSNVVNSDGVLQNADPSAGIPLTSSDGMIVGTPKDVTLVGITNEVLVFDAETIGNLFSTSNGSWSSLGGSSGPDVNNKVLIAQMTTNGVFSFELNIQIGTPTGGVQQFVARNPVGSQIQLPSLIYENIPEISLQTKIFIEGYYIPGTGMMDNYGNGGCLWLSSIDGGNLTPIPGVHVTDVDTVWISTMNPVTFAQVDRQWGILQTNGSVIVKFSAAVTPGNYYLKVNSRNSLETWGSLITLPISGTYNFSAGNQADYWFNMGVADNGIYLNYSGDIADDFGTPNVQNGYFEGIDFSTSMDSDIQTGNQGYVTSDLDGDGFCTSLDFLPLDPHIQSGGQNVLTP